MHSQASCWKPDCVLETSLVAAVPIRSECRCSHCPQAHFDPLMFVVAAAADMPQLGPQAPTGPSNNNYRQPLHASDNRAAATACEDGAAAHDPTDRTSSGRELQDSTTGADAQYDVQPETQQQQQQQEGQGQKHVQQQKPRPTHFVSLRVSHSPQVCWEAAAPASMCLVLLLPRVCIVF